MPNGGGSSSGIFEFTGNELLGNGDPNLYRVNQATGITQKILNGQVVDTFNTADRPGWQGMVNYAVSQGVTRPTQPETMALEQMAQIDPQTEALRQGLAQSYLSPLQTAGNVPMPRAPQWGPPSAADIQSYLNLYGQVDPTGLAARQQLGTALAQESALGTQLDPETLREITQGTREGQIARGNIYGTPALVQEAMTRGEAGLAMQQQRQQALQSYLSSGQDIGSVANQLYQAGLANYANQYNQYLGGWSAGQQNLRAAQSAAGGYLGSGVTPYQAAAGYLNTAQNQAASAAQGGPVFSPQGPSGYYTGAGTSSFPQYGLDISQLSNQWLQGLNYGQYAGYNAQLAAAGGRSGGISGMGAAKGAIGGAASGALAGAAAGGIGAIPGALIGAIGGGLGGAFSG
jgi:hypothetical protein